MLAGQVPLHAGLQNTPNRLPTKLSLANCLAHWFAPSRPTVSCAVWPSCHRNSVVRRKKRVLRSHRCTLHHWFSSSGKSRQELTQLAMQWFTMASEVGRTTRGSPSSFSPAAAAEGKGQQRAVRHQHGKGAPGLGAAKHAAVVSALQKHIGYNSLVPR